MTVRALAIGLAINRCAFGLAYLLAPERAGSGWIGRVASRPAAQIMVRGLGARDLALGIGALRALAAEAPNARGWLAAHARADASDLVATVAARADLPTRNLIFASGMAGASTAIAVTGAAKGPAGA
jgi:hypothetical protein